MAATQYEVGARLTLQGIGQAGGALGRIAGGLQTIADRIRGTSSGLGSIFRQIAGFGAAYLGFNAMRGLFGGLVRGAISFNDELGRTRIGLQSVLAATSAGTLNFQQAGAVADQVFRQLSDDAITSTATTQELFGIFQGIVGPIRAAGFGLQTVREITNSTVSAASALGVDFAQAQRDISLMVRGAAGMDVRLFSMLRSTGAITEDTQAWNRNLTTQQRVERLRQALAMFAPAAEAYGRSWAGLTSSLRDLQQQFLGALSSPVLERIRQFMAEWVDRLVANRDRIKATLQAIGEVIAARLGAILERAQRAISWVTEHWTQILSRVQSVIRIVRAIVPPALAGMFLARMVRSGAGGGLGMLAGILRPLSSVLGVLGRLSGPGGLLSLLGGGGGAAAAAGTTAAGGAAAAGGIGAIAWPVVLAGLAAAIGALMILLAVLGLIASAVYVAAGYWDQLVRIFDNLTPVLDAFWVQLQAVGAAIWDLIRPIVMLIGYLVLRAVWAGFIGSLVMFYQALVWIREALERAAAAMHGFEGVVGSAIRRLMGQAETQSAQIGQQFGGRRGGGTHEPGLGARIQQIMDEMRRAASGAGTEEGADGGRPAARTVNDFRGSRIEVRQEFRQADPDRIALQMIEDITAQAESRLSSGFAPALTG